MPNPISVTIELDIDRHLAGETYYDSDGDPVSSGPTTLESIVIDRVCASLVDRLVASAARDDWYTGITKRVAETRDAIIAEKLAPIIDQAIEASIQPTNALGEATCAPTTLRSMIVDQAQAWLGERKGQSGYGSKTRTNLETVIHGEVDRAWQKELVAAVEAGKAEVVAAVRESAAAVLAGTIARAAIDGAKAVDG